jgi:serine/threonine protein kinase
MSQHPSDETIQRLTGSGLMSPAEVEEFVGSLSPAERSDSQSLLRSLVKASRLTAYQAERLLRGNVRGLVLGEYTILERIGAGGMGEVFRARHRRMNRIVALKVLPPTAVASPEALRRFEREVAAIARFEEHPNVVTAYDAGESDGIHYLAMQFVDGQDLAALVARDGPLPVPEALDAVLQAARGLEYVHRQGVVHRDLKPGNLIRDCGGAVKLMDLGLARLIEGSPGDTTECALTGATQLMGTLEYMAPEQAEDTRQADHRSDIYGLGCTLYCLLAGRPPYRGDSPLKIVLAHREQPIPALTAVCGDVPPALDAIFRRMVAKRPEDRYQTMAEVVTALEGCRQPRKVPPRRIPPEPPPAPYTAVEQTEPQRNSPDTSPFVINTTRQQVVAVRDDTVAVRRAVRRRSAIVWLAVGGGTAGIALLLVLWIVLGGGNKSAPSGKTNAAAGKSGDTPPHKTARADTAWVPKPPAEEQPAFAHPELYEYLAARINSKYVLRMTYTEIATTMEQAQTGEWRIGAGMTRDGSAYEFSVRTGKWFARILSPEESRQKHILEKTVSRSVPGDWQLPALPLVTLRDARVRAEIDANGEKTLVGTIQCDRKAVQRVDHMQWAFICPVPDKDAANNFFETIVSDEPPSGTLRIERKLGANVDLRLGGRFYIQAFVFRPQAGFYRISNELVWTNEAADKGGPP